MTKPRIPEEEFARLFTEIGAAGISKMYGIGIRNVYRRRANMEKNKSLVIPSPADAQWTTQYQVRLPVNIENGTILIASDAHYWPDVITTGHRGFVRLIKDLQPECVIMNGDVFDGARASRHDRIMWESSPTIKQELEAVTDRLHEVTKAAPKAKLYWTIGNHDSRFETALSKSVSEFEGVHGFALRDHFPMWQFATSIWINDDVVIKHRYKGGVHATHNNTVAGGKSIVTGHLHSLKVTPYSDYNGLRFGVDTGTLTVPSTDTPGGPQTNYNEDNPQNHREGFIALTFKDGVLLWPEIAYVLEEGKICFRGQVISV
jgi:hypothetical protein